MKMFFSCDVICRSRKRKLSSLTIVWNSSDISIEKVSCIVSTFSRNIQLILSHVSMILYYTERRGGCFRGLDINFVKTIEICFFHDYVNNLARIESVDCLPRYGIRCETQDARIRILRS